MFYFKLCSVRKNTYNDDRVFYVGVFQVMSSVNAYHDQLIKKTAVFQTADGAKIAASLDQYGV